VSEPVIKLKPYQEQILDELDMLPSVALFMGTGSGKTYTSLFKVIQNNTPNLLVACPARVVEQWKESIRTVLPRIKVVDFPKTSNAKQKNAIISQLREDGYAIVVSLEVVAKLDSLKSKVNNRWSIIVDESHKIKELGTRRSPVQVTKAMIELGLKTPYKAILTATPTQKEFGGYVDYYTQLYFLGYMTLTPQQFEDRYCIIRKLQIPGTPYPIKKIVGYKNTQELDNMLALVSRRYIPKFTDGEPVNIVEYLEKVKSYNVLNKERWYEELNLQSLSAMRIAKKTLTSGVVMGHDVYGERKYYPDNIVKRDWVKSFLEDTDETIIIFYKYNVELEQLKEVCKELKLPYIVLNGANGNKKQSIESEGYRVVLGQYNAAGESIDGLQYRSHIVVYYAMPESSLEYVQSLGRIDRIGQDKLPMYYHLVMKGTIDEDIYDMTLRKVEFNEEVLDRLNIERRIDI
jgi:SNF2 family DNA or RNA helicase